MTKDFQARHSYTDWRKLIQNWASGKIDRDSEDQQKLFWPQTIFFCEHLIVNKAALVWEKLEGALKSWKQTAGG